MYIKTRQLVQDYHDDLEKKKQEAYNLLINRNVPVDEWEYTIRVKDDGSVDFIVMINNHRFWVNVSITRPFSKIIRYRYHDNFYYDLAIMLYENGIISIDKT